ncbi:hypothetical protein HanPI659440_Chr14g0549521 [Helianthus annuus]|nr:hypothetical protein HanPI659440_Chr14g0549521 [Helianthus annuus]
MYVYGAKLSVSSTQNIALREASWIRNQYAHSLTIYYKKDLTKNNFKPKNNNNLFFYNQGKKEGKFTKSNQNQHTPNQKTQQPNLHQQRHIREWRRDAPIHRSLKGV